jgi:hypothetical protein
MAKQNTIKNTLPKQPAKNTKSQASPSPSSFDKYFPFVITAVFFCFSVVGILNHEMWRDENQAWLVARDAHSLSELMQNVKYEGHPVLWHFLLYIITSFTHQPVTMQIFHILISAAFVFLFNRFAPFSIPEKILFTFGYYSLFEFNLISRGYGLGFLLIVIFCSLYKKRQHYYLPLFIVLVLLANTHVFGLLLSGCLGTVLFLDYLLGIKSGALKKLPLWQVVGYACFFIAGCALSAWQIYPEADNSFPVSYPTSLFEIPRIERSLAWMTDAYFVFPKKTDMHFWNTNLFENRFVVKDVMQTSINPLWPLMLFAVFCFSFLRKPQALLLYVMGTLGLFCFFYYTSLLYYRYIGHFFILLLAAMWLSHYGKEYIPKNSFLQKASALSSRAGQYLFTLFLFVGFLSGAYCYFQDMEYPFSTGKEAADFIRESKLDTVPIFAAHDFLMSPIAAELDRQLYYPEQGALGSFTIWDKHRIGFYNLNQVDKWLKEKQAQGAKKMLLVLDTQPPVIVPGKKKQGPLTEGMFTPTLHLQLIRTVQGGIVDDEHYFIYLVEERL